MKRCYTWNILALLAVALPSIAQQLAPVVPASSTACTPSAPVIVIMLAVVLLVAGVVYFLIARRKGGIQPGEAFMEDLARRIAQKILDAPVVVETAADTRVTYDGKVFASAADMEKYKALKEQMDALAKG